MSIWIYLFGFPVFLFISLGVYMILVALLWEHDWGYGTVGAHLIGAGGGIGMNILIWLAAWTDEESSITINDASPILYLNGITIFICIYFIILTKAHRRGGKSLSSSLQNYRF